MTEQIELPGIPPRPCAWCGGSIHPRLRSDARFCSTRCRQASHRFGAACVARRRADESLRLAYADPPYPGLAHRYYADHPDFGGEVDHRELLERLKAFDGWALSTSAEALPEVLTLARGELGLEVRVASWYRGGRPGVSARPRSAWEPVVYAGGRRVPSREACEDALVYRARPRTTDPKRVIGSKPAAFLYWLFDLLDARPGDELVDLFPGSGGVARAWRRLGAVSARAATRDLEGAATRRRSTRATNRSLEQDTTRRRQPAELAPE